MATSMLVSLVGLCMVTTMLAAWFGVERNFRYTFLVVVALTLCIAVLGTIIVERLLH